MCHKHYRDPAETAYMHQESVGAPRFSPLQNSAKIILPLHDNVNLLKIGQNSAPSFISSLKPLNNYLQYDRDRKHHIPQINVFTIKFIPSLQNNLLALLATSYVTLQYSMHHIP